MSKCEGKKKKKPTNQKTNKRIREQKNKSIRIERLMARNIGISQMLNIS